MESNFGMIAIIVCHCYLLCVLFVILDKFWNDFFHVAYYYIVGNLVDGGIGVVVDRNNDARVLHTSDVLDLTRDTTGDIDFRCATLLFSWA